MVRARIDPVKPPSAEFTRLSVASSDRVSPHIQRLVLTGPAAFTPLGFDQWFRAFVKRPGQAELTLLKDITLRSYVRYATMPERTRPLLRNYTVRELRGEEVVVDVVVHGDPNPSSPTFASWAQTAEPGEPIAVLDEGRMWNPPGDTQTVLIVAEESGLPAVAGICRDLPRDARGVVVLELPDAADHQDLNAPEGVVVHEVARSDPHDRPGVAALETVSSVPWPENPYVFAVGEQALPVAVRRLATERGVPKQHITFSGYWRVGKATYR